MIKAILLGMVFSVLTFSCDLENMHLIGESLIKKGFVKVEGNKFIVDNQKIDKFIEENGNDDQTILLISFTLLEYPKNHNLELVQK